MASDVEFQPVKESGWLSGLPNMLRKENGNWWNTRLWLIQIVVWTLLLNGLHLMVLYLSGQDSSFPMRDSFASLTIFFALMGGMTPFGVMILTQGAIIEEKKSGTAEWVLSAPLSREAFVFSKLAVNLLWIFGVLVLLQGAVYEVVLMAFGMDIIAVGSLIQGLLLHGFHLLFWLTLTLMLGTFFKGRGAVIGIPVLLLGFQDLIADLGRTYLPGLELWLPKRIEEIATQATIGGPVSSIVPLFAIGLQIVIFTIVAFWRFKREEF
jgi:ABC-type transport system involved in multi-copper enzyme maturation permease subunit